MPLAELTGPVAFNVLGEPGTKGSKRAVWTGKGGKRLDKPRVLDDSPKTKSWAAEVASHAMIAMSGRPMFIDTPLVVTIEFRLLRPAGQYRPNGTLKPSAPNTKLRQQIAAAKAVRSNRMSS
ncbi:MAG: hypothetical protein ABI665_27645 [Vicinamibacterales bacterium]